MDPNEAHALAIPVAAKVGSVRFRAIDSPTDLEEFYAYYDEGEQKAVIAKAHAAVSAFSAGFEQVKGDPESAKVFVRALMHEMRDLCASLQAADKTFDPAAVEAALTSVTFAPTQRALANAAAARAVATPGAREAALEVFGFLATSKADRALLEEVAAKALDVKKKGGTVELSFADKVVTCTRPAKPAAGVPPSYAAIAKRFGSVLWKHGGPSMGFVGVDKSGKLTDGSWEWQALEEGDNAKLLAALKKARRKPGDIHCAFACGSNWILFDPTREAKSGEPALAFVSHGDCEWVPMKSADALDASGVLLRLMAWSLAGKTGLFKEIFA